MQNSGVRRINDAVRRLNRTVVENQLNPPDGSAGAPFALCAATRVDWGRYVQSEWQELKSHWMAWWDDTVFIIELPGILYGLLVEDVRDAISGATGTGKTHLRCYGAGSIGRRQTVPDNINDLLADLQPDSSFGPRQFLPRAVLPQGFTWQTFHTLKVEIGVSQGWGRPIRQAEQEGQAGPSRLATLNEKADAWRQCRGVQYVLCIHVSSRLGVREYRLDSIVDGEFEDPSMQHAPIDQPTIVQFDARRLLGIPPGGALPAGFNDPVQFNLFDVVDVVINEAQAGRRG